MCLEIIKLLLSTYYCYFFQYKIKFIILNIEQNILMEHFITNITYWKKKDGNINEYSQLFHIQTNGNVEEMLGDTHIYLSGTE